MTIVESEQTLKARDILVKALKAECFNVQEEKKFYCKNNMGENITPPYSADIFASIQFIIELDPLSTHGGDIKSKKDKWRNKNIYEQYGVPTIRLQPEDVLKEGGLAMAFKEMLSQLKEYQK